LKHKFSNTNQCFTNNSARMQKMMKSNDIVKLKKKSEEMFLSLTLKHKRNDLIRKVL
jgi:hypothetical protein